MGLTTEYSGVEIRYRENLNDWVFELKGREKAAASLRLAKDAIDNAPKEQKKVIRFEAYFLSRISPRIPTVTVGACSKDFRGRAQFWITNNGQRSKEAATQLMKITEANTERVARYHALSDEIQELQRQQEALITEMERIEVPTE